MFHNVSCLKRFETSTERGEKMWDNLANSIQTEWTAFWLYPELRWIAGLSLAVVLLAILF